MNLSIKKRSLPILLTLMLILSMFAGLTVSASAAGAPYPNVITMTALWNGGTPGTADPSYQYSISSATELSYFSQFVNGGNAHVGVTFFLTTGFSLSAVSPWTPIGTSTAPFNGVFDGSNNDPAAPNAITDLNVTYVSGQADYYGLFGYALYRPGYTAGTTGVVKNVTVSGTINTSTNSVEYVGGIVGYTTSDVYNCHTNVTITAPDGVAVGGIAGAIEDTSTFVADAPFHIQASSATGNVTGYTRVGGIVGAVYSAAQGNIIVDNCYYANGVDGGVPVATIDTESSTTRSWIGGIVGYCRGYVTNSYAIASFTSAGGHYIGGIAGLLQGTGPQAQLSNSYAAASFGTGTSVTNDRPLYASGDGSATLPITDCLYDSTLAGSYTNPPGDGTTATGWGSWVSTGYGATTDLQGTTTNTQVYSYDSGWSTAANPLNVLGAAFSADSSTPPINAGYPVLIWQTNSANLPVYVPGENAATIPTEGIYIDGANGSDSGAGTFSSPVLTLTTALKLAADDSQDVYVINNPVPINDTTANSLNLAGTTYAGVTIYRSIAYYGVLFSVASGVTADVTSVTIDGNSQTAGSSSGFSLFDVTGGTLTIGAAATLQNNVSTYGGGIIVESGSAELDGGTIATNKAILGGAVYLAGGTFTLTSGSITRNTAQNNGGAISSRGTVAINGGSITNNQATSTGSNAYGGALAILGASTATLTAGTITDNTATTAGNGIYVGSTAANAFVVTPASGETFDVTDVVYLTTGAVITLTAVLASPDTLTVQCQTPGGGVVIANTGGDDEIAEDSVDQFSYSGGGYDIVVDDNYNLALEATL
jgi:hypothetical protein